MSRENNINCNFEQSFGERSLEQQIRICEKDESANMFVRYLKDKQPVLEAGCGSGRWMHFLKRYNVRVVGIDWSQRLKYLSNAYDPEVQFDVGDLRALPYPDEYFGSVLALGSIEHVVEGPRVILSEFYRVLKRDGIAIITVPYYSWVRKMIYCLKSPIKEIKYSTIFCNILNKPIIKSGAKKYNKDMHMDEQTFNGQRRFFQYQFTKKQLKDELEMAGFRVISIKGQHLDEGIYHNIYPVGGRWLFLEGRFQLSKFGEMLKKMFNAEAIGHMICAIVKK